VSMRLPACAVVLVATAACTQGGAVPTDAQPQPRVAATAGSAAPLPPLRTRVRPDVLVVATTGLSPGEIASLRSLARGGFTTLRYGEVGVGTAKRRAAGIDPAAFRPFAPRGTAEATQVWSTIARGEAAVAHDTATELKLKLGATLELAGARKLPVRLGVLATVGLPELDLVVSDRVAADLGLAPDTAAVLSAGPGDPVALARAARTAVGGKARVDLVTEPDAPPTAFLSGSKAAKAFGAFSYRFHPDGTIEPDATWVRRNIRYGTVPVIGSVRCHRLMFPQLRSALTEVERAGLGRKLHSFAGCYVPRFIERDPDRPVSLHTWGIAVDFNPATNAVGTHGDMDPRIVAIFEKWGFAWGGRWRVPDPMHFELAALLNKAQ
jgi:hypothetical protein